MDYELALGWAWLCSVTSCPWAIYWISPIPHLQRGQSDSIFLSGLSWGSDGEVPVRCPAQCLAHWEAFVQWWLLLLLVGLSHMLVGKTCPLLPLTLADLSMAVGDRTQQQLLGPRGLLFIPTAQSTAFILWLCWAVTGHGVGGRPGGQPFPWCILVPLQQAVPGVGRDHLDLRRRLQSRPGKGAVCQASALVQVSEVRRPRFEFQACFLRAKSFDFFKPQFLHLKGKDNNS